MASELIAAVAAIALLTLAPGPDLALVTRAALGAGRGGAFRATFGIAGGLLVWGVLAVAGLAALLAASSTAYLAVKYVGAAYLVWLGLQTLWKSRQSTAAPLGRVQAMPHPARTGLVTNLLNPKIGVFYTGLLPQLVPAGAPHAPAMAALVLVHVALSIGWLLTYAAIVDRASLVLTRPAVRRTLDRVTGLVLVGFGIRVASTRH